MEESTTASSRLGEENLSVFLWTDGIDLGSGSWGDSTYPEEHLGSLLLLPTGIWNSYYLDHSAPQYQVLRIGGKPEIIQRT